MFYILSFLWFCRTTKVTLFYLYLWQLKEYRFGRFLDHFRTEKGKRLILNKINFFKIVLFFGFLYFLLTKGLWREEFLNFLPGLLIIFYAIEFLWSLGNLFKGQLKRPVLTKKAIFLIFIGLLIEIIIISVLLGWQIDIFYLAFWLLIFDIIFPIIISLIVLLMQPLTILLRNRIIKKAKIKRAQFKELIVIGITGSYGKTSTKEFLAQILSEKATLRGGAPGASNVLKTSEHQNTEIGVAQCVLNDLKPEHQVFVVEMGAYKRGEIKLLCEITKPKIGILTGINEQHLALFGSQDNIINAKFELIESLPENGIAIFNGDNPFCQELFQKTNKIKRQYTTFSTIVENIVYPDIWAENLRIEKEFISFTVKISEGESADFKVNVLGGHNVSNILAATIVAKELGMTLEEVSRVLLKIKPEQGAMRLIKGKEEINILDSSYSANPDGVISDLEYIKNAFPPTPAQDTFGWGSRKREGGGRVVVLRRPSGPYFSTTGETPKKIIVMPCLIELGKASKEVHKRIGRKIGEVCDLAIITTKERFKEIKEGAMESEMKEENILFLENSQEIITKLSIFCSAGDTVLFEGRAPKELLEQLTI